MEIGQRLCGVPQRLILGALLFLLYINDMGQAVKCELRLYADDTCLIFQHSEINEIEIQLNKNFSSICNWFVGNKLSIHFDEDKTKSILFSSKSKIKNASSLNIQFKGKKVKQYSKVTYLGCIFDIPVLRLLCNAMIQPFFDYACKAWYPNLNKNLKARLEAAQNKCIRFCLKLGDRKSITVKEFEKRINCQFTKGSISAYFLVYTNFMQKKYRIIWIKFLSCRVQQNSYTLLLSKTKAPSSQSKSSFESFIDYWSLIME